MEGGRFDLQFVCVYGVFVQMFVYQVDDLNFLVGEGEILQGKLESKLTSGMPAETEIFSMNTISNRNLTVFEFSLQKYYPLRASSCNCTIFCL